MSQPVRSDIHSDSQPCATTEYTATITTELRMWQASRWPRTTSGPSLPLPLQFWYRRR